MLHFVTPRRGFVVSLLLPAMLVGMPLAVAQPDPESEATNTVDVPPLSVESLFHPDQRFDYFGKPAPRTRWLDDSHLVVRENDEWVLIDPITGEREVWGWPEVARQEVNKIGGFSEKSLKTAADSLINSAESLEHPVMIRIDNAIAVIGGNNPPRLVTRDARAWKIPSLSPDGSAIAYVRDNDLFVMKVHSGEILRLTTEGSETLLCGYLDWTYQEEIYGRGNFKGYWWSPDSRQIAFLRIDISEVLPFTLTKGQSYRGEALVTPYPKAGDPIPKCSLMVVDTETLQSSTVHRPEKDEAESLVVRVTWRPDGQRLTYQIQNRIQTWLELRESDLGSSKSRVLLREEGPAWIEILGEPHWLPGGDFLWLSDLPAGRRHVWRVSNDGSRRIPITAGDWDVREIERVIPEERYAFVTGDRTAGITGQQLYRVHWSSGSEPAGEMVPMTATAGWHATDIAPDGSLFVDTFSTLDTEPTKRLYRIEGAEVEEVMQVGMNANDESRAPWQSLPLVTPNWMTVQTRDGVDLPAYIIPPWDVERVGAGTKFPVLVYTYGGPQAPSAVNRWSGRNFLFHQYLASQGVGVFVVDNRSSGGHGIADTWTIHRRVGVQELEDLLDAVEVLKNVSWVDGDRLAMRGWSFGGFYTSYAMTQSDAFAAGIAGGSVTDWRNYDAFYTERYMDTPQNNESGYQETSVVEHAENLSGRLLLIHGEVDDNVHPGNTLQLVAALQKAGKQFDLMFYPNTAHGVRNPPQVYHLYRMMTDFLLRTLDAESVSVGNENSNQVTDSEEAATAG